MFLARRRYPALECPTTVSPMPKFEGLPFASAFSSWRMTQWPMPWSASSGFAAGLALGNTSNTAGWPPPIDLALEGGRASLCAL